MTNEITKPRAEVQVVRGRTYEEVVRKLHTEFPVTDGWAIVRTVNKIITLDVYVERSTAQAVATKTEVYKETVVEPVETSLDTPVAPPEVEIKPVAKTTKKVVK